MDWRRVVDAGANLFGCKRCHKRIALLCLFDWNSDCVLVVHVGCAICNGRNDYALDVCIQIRSICLALRCPRRQLSQLNPPDCRMNIGHSGVETDHLVLVALFHALVA
ncbi:hypothetical protein GALL_424840 [mine drainage metagenome]|uniref:Uncharacterized protein n=1 Tax=mine drainage metagenome TaxID=410659 RepID=A0A1J5PY46_9ZZZZ